LEIVTGLSAWFVPLCLFAGVLAAGLLYYKNRSEDFSGKLLVLLSVLRFLSVGLITFLLLSPMVKTLVRTTEKPIIALAVDNSRSMLSGPDSGYLAGEFNAHISNLRTELSSKYELVNYTFGSKVSATDTIKFNEQSTNISDLVDEINNRYFNRNLGALILISDGIYNAGADPFYALKSQKYPVFCVGSGDSTQHRDLLIRKLTYNKVAYKGNRFPVEIMVQGYKATGNRVSLKILKNDIQVFEKEITFTSDNQVITAPVLLDAEETGRIRYRVVLGSLSDEVSKSNNVRDFIIEVREHRLKVAIVGNAPHPDLGALYSALENSSSFEATRFTGESGLTNITDFDLVIFHQIPSDGNPASRLMSQITSAKIPTLYILGNQSEINSFNKQQIGVQLIGYNGSTNESLPLLNRNFPLFSTSEALNDLLTIVPPLASPFAKYSISANTYTLAYQTIGAVNTTMPLIAFTQNQELRTAVITGEGIWRWRLADFSKNGNHLAFNELVDRTLQYLAVKPDKSRLKISARDYYAENEIVSFNATLLNDSYQPENNSSLKITITGEDKRKYGFDFTPSGEGYLLNAGVFQPGIYQFQAIASSGTGDITVNGSFVVTALDLEDVNTVANFGLLRKMAVSSGGEFFNIRDASALPKVIQSRADVKPMSFAQKRFTDLVSFLPLLILLILSLSAEWFLRKYFGSY